eukprot:518902-Rhodomonas_salina.2
MSVSSQITSLPRAASDKIPPPVAAQWLMHGERSFTGTSAAVAPETVRGNTALAKSRLLWKVGNS